MGKIKSHKASAKRFSLTKSGKVKMTQQVRRHKTGAKSAKRMRSLRKSAYIAKGNAENIKKLLPYA